MIEIRKTHPDGTTEQMTFDSTTSAAAALSALFDVKQGESIMRAERRQALNDELRAAARRGLSVDDPKKLIDRARQNF